MKFKLEIDCDNEAFGEGGFAGAFEETRRIILDLLQRLDDGRASLESKDHVLRDSNGNRVGLATFTKGGK